MNAIAMIELQACTAIHNQHAEKNKDTNKKCKCNYCETFRKAVEVFIKPAKKTFKYNR